MKRLLWILGVYVSLIFCIPIYAEEVYVYEDSTESNIKVEILADDDLEFKTFDIYRITYYLQERDQRGHFDIDAGGGAIKGYLEPGTYQVQGITYMGNTESLRTQPAAINCRIRIYKDTLTYVTLSIGKNSIDSFTEKEGAGNVYTELVAYGNIDTSLTSNDLLLEEKGSYQTMILDETVFDDEEQYQSYITYMREHGYMDAYGNYTDKAFEEMEASNKDDESQAENDHYSDIKENPSLADDSHVTEKRFDESEEPIIKEEPVLMTSIINTILKIIPAAAFLGILMLIAWKNKRTDK